MKKISAVVLLGSFLTGCSTIPEPGTPEAALWLKEQKEEKRMEAAEEGIDNLPGWFLEPDCSLSAVCASSTAVSEDLQLAMDKAVLDAKFTIADKLRGLMSGKIKRFVEELDEADQKDLYQETTKVVQSLFTDVKMAGYRVAEREIGATKQGYRAYVLVEYPIGEANKVFLNEVKGSGILEKRQRAKKAFAELEAEINGAK